jgi:hypothetical protein
MKTNETYAIAILRQAYQPDLMGIETVQFDRDDEYYKINEFDSIEKAQERIDELDDATYCIRRGESDSPEYLIVDKNTIEYIQFSRFGVDNYDRNWDCDHLDKDGNPCGECHNCTIGMRYEDRSFIRKFAIKA